MDSQAGIEATVPLRVKAIGSGGKRAFPLLYLSRGSDVPLVADCSAVVGMRFPCGGCSLIGPQGTRAIGGQMRTSIVTAGCLTHGVSKTRIAPRFE